MEVDTMTNQREGQPWCTACAPAALIRPVSLNFQSAATVVPEASFSTLASPDGEEINASTANSSPTVPSPCCSYFKRSRPARREDALHHHRLNARLSANARLQRFQFVSDAEVLQRHRAQQAIRDCRVDSGMARSSPTYCHRADVSKPDM